MLSSIIRWKTARLVSTRRLARLEEQSSRTASVVEPSKCRFNFLRALLAVVILAFTALVSTAAHLRAPFHQSPAALLLRHPRSRSRSRHLPCQLRAHLRYLWYIQRRAILFLFPAQACRFRLLAAAACPFPAHTGFLRLLLLCLHLSLRPPVPLAPVARALRFQESPAPTQFLPILSLYRRRLLHHPPQHQLARSPLAPASRFQQYPAPTQFLPILSLYRRRARHHPRQHQLARSPLAPASQFQQYPAPAPMYQFHLPRYQSSQRGPAAPVY
jgi:hypothetical protein